MGWGQRQSGANYSEIQRGNHHLRSPAGNLCTTDNWALNYLLLEFELPFMAFLFPLHGKYHVYIHLIKGRGLGERDDSKERGRQKANTRRHALALHAGSCQYGFRGRLPAQVQTRQPRLHHSGCGFQAPSSQPTALPWAHVGSSYPGISADTDQVQPLASQSLETEINIQGDCVSHPGEGPAQPSLPPSGPLSVHAPVPLPCWTTAPSPCAAENRFKWITWVWIPVKGQHATEFPRSDGSERLEGRRSLGKRAGRRGSICPARAPRRALHTALRCDNWRIVPNALLGWLFVGKR